ncbi:hypothetical protein PAJL_622 [Cutibacterium acnes HL042PA3]|nr:hypothetical protein PAJL_622 [Cutibacterium acnes HL042PA3]
MNIFLDVNALDDQI